MADGWDAFSVAPGGQQQGQQPAPASASTDDGWAAFSVPAGQQQANPAAPSSPAAPAGKTGYLANTAANMVLGAGDMLNVASDPFGNLIGKPLVAIGAAAHDALAPMLGYHKFSPEERAALFNDDVPQSGTRVINAVGDAIGASPNDVHPGSTGESLVGSGVRAAVGMLGAGVGAGATIPQLAAGAGAGFTGGATGDAAQMLVPDAYKPVANLAGNVLGGGVVAGGAGLLHGAGNSLADAMAPVSGRRNTLMDSTGTPMTTADGTTISATNNQLQAAGNQLLSVTQDPAAVQNSLAAPTPSPVPGVQPTTAQLTRDPGLAMQEYRASRSGTPLEQAAFKGRADANNDARVTALDSVAQGDPSAVPAEIQQQAETAGQATAADVARARAAALTHVEQVRQAGEQQVGGAQAQAGQALDAAGGNLPAGSDAQVGAALRAPIASQYQVARTGESQLWNAIDPNGTLAVDMSPVRAQAHQIAREIGPNAAAPAGGEADILGVAQNLPDVQSFRDLADLKSRLTSQIRDARIGGRDQEVRRLSQLLGSVHDTMAGAANSADIAPAAASAPAPRPAPSAPDVGSDVFTPSGQRIPVQYQVADASELVTSHGADMQPNPAFPPELQPRDRDRAASGVQVARIAGQLQPERLGASSTVADGAPIVGPDGVVESGNGRVMAIRQAYAADGPQAQGYRDWLAGQGHDTTGMQQPILVRRRVGDMTPEQRQSFVSEANAPTTLAMSSTERAASDAGKLSDDVLQHYQPGDVTDPGNRDFARSFIRNVADPGQEGALVTADGSLSQEGAARMRAALVHRAYGDKGLSAALSETTDPTARVLAGAMQDAAGPMARLKAGIEAGYVDPAVDITPALVEATQVVQSARQRGITLPDAMAQRDAFNPVSSRAENILKAAYGPQLSGRMSQAKMTDLLSAYARQAQEQSSAGNLFGANLTADQLFEGVSSRYGKATGTEGSYAPGNARGVGQGDGGYGNQARGPVDGAGGQAAPGGSGGQQGGGRVLEQAPLAPNFDQAAADRYAAARQATVDRVATYKNAPGVGQVLAPGQTSGSFRTPDSGVASIIVKAGPQGADTARAYLAAGGSTQALSDAAAYSLRQAAMRPDGTLDPAKYQTWAQGRAGFLSHIPDAAARFGAAADAQRAATGATASSALSLKQAAIVAQRTVDEAVAAQAASTRAMQTSVLGKFLGDADPVVRVGQILRDKATGQANMDQLAQAVASNPEAKAGLQRAVAEYVQRDLIGNTKGAASESGYIKNDRYQTFLRDAGPALEKVMTPEQMRGFHAVADSLEQANFSSQVGIGSPTPQLTAGRGETLLQKVGRDLVGPGLGGTVGSSVGFAIAGPWGVGPGAAIGGVLGKALQSAREAGVQNIEHLKTEALLNPELFKLLMTKVTRQNEAGVLGSFADQMRRVSLVGAVQATNQQPVAAPTRPVAPPQVRPVARSAPTLMNSLLAPAAMPPPQRLNLLMR